MKKSGKSKSNKKSSKKIIWEVKVRWWDGYLETFEVVKVRAGAYVLWLELIDGDTRSIPLIQVRWHNGLK